jgi:hypothetical protein
MFFEIKKVPESLKPLVVRAIKELGGGNDYRATPRDVRHGIGRSR